MYLSEENECLKGIQHVKDGHKEKRECPGRFFSMILVRAFGR